MEFAVAFLSKFVEVSIRFFFRGLLNVTYSFAGLTSVQVGSCDPVCLSDAAVAKEAEDARRTEPAIYIPDLKPAPPAPQGFVSSRCPLLLFVPGC